MPPRLMELRFHDSSVLRNVVLSGTIELHTKYGKLTIPIDDARRIEFGVHMSEETAKKLERALTNLGSTVFQEREAAGRELVALGRFAYPALQRLAKGADLETTKRVEALIKEISAKVPAYQLRLKEEDVVFTADSVIAGRLVGQLDAKSEHLGDMRLKMSHLRELRAIGKDENLTVTVDAAQHNGASNQWLETDFTVEKGSKVMIAASGQVKFGGGQFVCGPEGLPNFVVNIGGMKFLCGTLLGRIGADGTPFAIGKRYENTAPVAGKLYLSIVPGQGNVPSGSYEVKMSTRAEVDMK